MLSATGLGKLHLNKTSKLIIIMRATMNLLKTCRSQVLNGEAIDTDAQNLR